MTSADRWTIIGAAATIVLTMVIQGNSIRSEAAADRAAAAADRRAFQEEMQRLSERQAHVEGHVSQVVAHR